MDSFRSWQGCTVISRLFGQYDIESFAPSQPSCQMILYHKEVRKCSIQSVFCKENNRAVTSVGTRKYATETITAQRKHPALGWHMIMNYYRFPAETTSDFDKAAVEIVIQYERGRQYPLHKVETPRIYWNQLLQFTRQRQADRIGDNVTTLIYPIQKLIDTIPEHFLQSMTYYYLL